MGSNLYIAYYGVQTIRTFVDVEDNSEPKAQDDVLITKRLWLFRYQCNLRVPFLPLLKTQALLYSTESLGSTAAIAKYILDW